MEWLSYLLKVSACTVLFFGFYLLVLQKLTFFKINRFYLVSSLFLSFLIPAMEFTLVKKVSVPVARHTFQHAPIQGFGHILADNSLAVPAFDWLILLPLAYFTVLAGLIFISGKQLFQLLKSVKKPVWEINGLKIVFKTEGFTNCSFFNYVFINPDSLNESEMAILLRHEDVHAKQLHSVDKMLLMIFKSVLWFNPVIYLYDKALEQVNEYEADEITAGCFGSKAYAVLLLKLAVAKSDMPLIHNFVKKPLKNRVKMLFNAKSGSMKKLNYLLALPVGVGLLWLFAVQVVYASKFVSPVNEAQISSKANGKSFPQRSIRVETSLNIRKESLEKLKIADKIHLQKNIDSIESNPVFKAKILTFSKMTGDTKSQVSYLEDAVIEINNYVLNAKYVVLDNKNGLLTATETVFKRNDETEKADKMIFDLNRGTRLVEGLQLTPGMDKKIEYKADSVRFSKSKAVIYLYGNAQVSYDDVKITGSKIVYDSYSKLIRATNSAFHSSKAGVVVNADSLIYSTETQKARLFGGH